jgi:methyltransferase domain protein
MLGGSPHFSKPNFKNSPRLALFWQKIAEHWDKKAPSFNEGVLKSSYANEFISKVDFNSGKYKPRQEFMHWAFVRVDKNS